MLTCKNVIVNGRRTSMRLHEDTWKALADICVREGIRLSHLCTRIDKKRGNISLSSATRIFVLAYYKNHLEQYETLLREKEPLSLAVPKTH